MQGIFGWKGLTEAGKGGFMGYCRGYYNCYGYNGSGYYMGSSKSYESTRVSIRAFKELWTRQGL